MRAKKKKKRESLKNDYDRVKSLAGSCVCSAAPTTLPMVCWVCRCGWGLILLVSGVTASLDPVKPQGELCQAQVLLHGRGGQAWCWQAAVSSTRTLASFSLQGSPNLRLSGTLLPCSSPVTHSGYKL